MVKKCVRCLIDKPFEAFNKKTKSLDGMDWQCRECAKKWMQEYRKKPDVLRRQRKYSKKYNRINRDKCKKAQLEWISNNGDAIRDYHLTKKYGLSLVEYKKLLALQNDSCAICKAPQSQFKKALYVDHDHVTKKVRGLLCYQCNIILGHFDDSIEQMNSAIAYIQKYA